VGLSCCWGLKKGDRRVHSVSVCGECGGMQRMSIVLLKELSDCGHKVGIVDKEEK
jgi:hypothetical protein